jgi:hypothetical protein
MSNRTRSILKAIAAICVLLAVVMKLGYVSIPAIAAYTFWMVVLGFALLLVASK